MVLGLFGFLPFRFSSSNCCRCSHKLSNYFREATKRNSFWSMRLYSLAQFSRALYRRPKLDDEEKKYVIQSWYGYVKCTTAFNDHIMLFWFFFSSFFSKLFAFHSNKQDIARTLLDFVHKVSTQYLTF